MSDAHSMTTGPIQGNVETLLQVAAEIAIRDGIDAALNALAEAKERVEGLRVASISDALAIELTTDEKMRRSYLAVQTRAMIAAQIRALRIQRGWSQRVLADNPGKVQSNVSHFESRQYGNFALNTLVEIANAFCVGLLVRFVPYAEFLEKTQDLSIAALQVEEFRKSSLLSRVTHNVSPVASQSLGRQRTESGR